MRRLLFITLLTVLALVSMLSGYVVGWGDGYQRGREDGYGLHASPPTEEPTEARK